MSRAVWRQAEAVTESGVVRDAAYGEPLGRVGALVLPEITNWIINPRAAGTFTGSVPVPPGWGPPFRGGSPAMTLTYTPGEEIDGARYVDVRYENNTGGQRQANVQFNAQTGAYAPALNGQRWTGSVSIALVDGTLPPSTPFTLGCDQRGSGGSYLSTLSGPNINSSITDTLQRFDLTVTTNNASIQFISFAFNSNATIPDGADFTLRFWLPQLEQGPGATIPGHGDLPGWGWDDTPDASPSTRAASTLTIAADLSAASFGAALGFAPLYDSAALPAGEYVVYDRRDDADNRVTLAYERPENRWALHRYAGGSDDPLYVADTFTAGSVKHLAIGGDAEHLYLQVDGGTRNAGENAMPLVLTSTAHDIGQAGGLGALPAVYAYAIPYWRAFTEAEGAHFASLSRPPHTGDVPRVVLP